MPTAEEFREQLLEIFRVAEERRLELVVVNSRELHRKIGGYPNRGNHRMSVCCGVMRSAMRRGDLIVNQPLKGKGANLTIEYEIPRSRQGGKA
jgi:hypothetical protein